MQILDLKLTNFRNYSNLKLNFLKSTNIIIGNNGVGKTNLIESIYVLGLTKSFRGSNEQIIIKKDEISTKIEGTILTKSKNNYQVVISNVGKKVKVNNKKQEKLSDYISNINIILFNPDDLKIIKNSPSYRRKLLDIEISQLNNTYLKLLNSYNKVLKQRNSYLKTLYLNSFSSKEYLNILTEQLVDLGIKINKERDKFIKKINEKISTIYEKITKIKGLVVEYDSSYNNLTKDELLKKYNSLYEKDLSLGITQFGIHHDDLIFLLNEDNLKDYGSEGQQKNAIISFKLSEIEIFKDIKGEYPILILDDLNSSLDDSKINNIIKLLNKDIQIFITTTNIKNINKKILKNSKIFKITDNEVEEEIYEK